MADTGSKRKVDEVDTDDDEDIIGPLPSEATKPAKKKGKNIRSAAYHISKIRNDIMLTKTVYKFQCGR